MGAPAASTRPAVPALRAFPMPPSPQAFPMLDMLKRFWTDSSGSTAIEYALIAGLLVLAVVSSVGWIGPPLRNLLYSAANGFPTP